MVDALDVTLFDQLGESVSDGVVSGVILVLEGHAEVRGDVAGLRLHTLVYLIDSRTHGETAEETFQRLADSAGRQDAVLNAR